MQKPFATVTFALTAAALVLASCTGGEKQPAESSKLKMAVPGHLVMQGRINSVIEIHNVSYPQKDHTRSIPGDMRIFLPGPALTDGAEIARMATSGAVSVQFPPVQGGEIPHDETANGTFTETPDGRDTLSPTGNRTVGYVQIELDSGTETYHFTLPLNLLVTDCECIPDPSTPEPVWEDWSDGDPHSTAGRWVQSYHMTYRGVVTTGTLHVTSTQVTQYDPFGFTGEIELADCEFTWTCDETRVQAADNKNNNPGQPLAPF